MKRIRASIVFLWLYAFQFSLLAFLCWCDESFQIYLYAFCVFLPFVMMLASYHCLKKKSAKLTRFSFVFSRASTQAKKVVQRERQISITVLIMSMVFLAAWFPFVVVDFVLVCCTHCRSQGLLLPGDITLSLGVSLLWN